jgi:hypothetical protein
MPEPHDLLPMYLHLARASGQRRRPLVRDKLLVLAAVEAQQADLPQVADRCRKLILTHNPGHLVGQFPNVASAVGNERFEALVKQLRRHFPPEKAEHMLGSLGIHLAGERATYYTPYEYAAALLGTTPDALDAEFATGEARPDTSSFAAPSADPSPPGSGGSRATAGMSHTTRILVITVVTGLCGAAAATLWWLWRR